jgi:hypothetical protein
MSSITMTTTATATATTTMTTAPAEREPTPSEEPAAAEEPAPEQQQTLVPIELDLRDTRSSRQRDNNATVCQNIKDNDRKAFAKNTNEKEVDRTLEDLELTLDEFWIKCQEDVCFCKLTARHLSKCASRQGSKDETEQLRACGLTSQQCGVKITNLSATAFRPTKDGEIVANEEMKNRKIQKDCCLKSFDASIEGAMTGYISAKVSYGSGGHQDNVFEEMDTMAEWWEKHRATTDDCLVLLIDTDLNEKFTRLKQKYEAVQNVMVFDHRGLQEYIIGKYYSSESA